MACLGPPRHTAEAIAAGASAAAAGGDYWPLIFYGAGGAFVFIGIIGLWFFPDKGKAGLSIGAGLTLGLTGNFLSYFERYWYLWLACGLIWALLKYQGQIKAYWHRLLDKTRRYDNMPPQ